jgi:hypothetical protein
LSEQASTSAGMPGCETYMTLSHPAFYEIALCYQLLCNGFAQKIGYQHKILKHCQLLAQHQVAILDFCAKPPKHALPNESKLLVDIVSL